MIEKDFDIPFLANLALREKQIQQNYRPIIAVHKWFARRPGTLFRGLLLSEFVSGCLPDTFYCSHKLSGVTVADPFMGGGTPVLEANRLGCNTIGCDINPMAYWIVERELANLDLEEYRFTANALRDILRQQVGDYYLTRCTICGNEAAEVKYFLWVKTLPCEDCGKIIDLFPGYTLSANKRHPYYVLICGNCGELNEVTDPKHPKSCRVCASPLQERGGARGNRTICPYCGASNRYPRPSMGAPTHRMVAIEYYCPQCKLVHKGRFFKKPDERDLHKFQQADHEWSLTPSYFVPEEEILAGDESTRLHRWGYRKYLELFNSRQLLGLEQSCRFIDGLPPGEVKEALATNLSDLLRYQNMLCRYDTSALKSLDIFSVHGFPVGLMQCESNLLGIIDERKGSTVGSGGWSNIIEKYARAKEYCRSPFEIRHHNGRKVQIPIQGEWIGSNDGNKNGNQFKIAKLYCSSSTELELPPASLDAVMTDPPYFGNVQYAELMDFCYVWLRRLAGADRLLFKQNTTRDKDELTGNFAMERGLAEFLEGMSRVFQNMAQALKPGAPFVFTYHHNDLKAYIPVAVALLDSGLVCSASLPCPAEMGASIHINGTGSSIMDTVFVCRSTGTVARHTVVSTAKEIAHLVLQDLMQLEKGGVKYTQGDMRCIAYGHLIRLAVWHLKDDWTKQASAHVKMTRVTDKLESWGGWPEVRKHILANASAPEKQKWVALEKTGDYGGDRSEISF